MEPAAHMIPIPDQLLKTFGKEISSLRGVNSLPPELKERVYASLIPPDLLSAYGVDPSTLVDREGHRAFQFDFPPDQGFVKIQFRRSTSEIDPIVFIHLSDTNYNQVEFEWIIIND